ncbi:N-lysine methyltransferase KMT5A-like [Oculina patagonica]
MFVAIEEYHFNDLEGSQVLSLGGRLMCEKIHRYMFLNPKPVPPIELHGVPSDPRGAGICAFASRDIHKNEIICEYEGEVVTEVEARAREVLYREQGKACALMVLESGGRQIAIDPYRGNALTDLPWGATLNHSRNKPNVKPFVANRNTDNPRVFLVALYDIAQTVELLWDYNDSEWALYSNSQTLL